MVVEWNTTRGVTVARARASDDHVVDGVVILFVDLRASIQQVVAQSVQLGEVNTQVCHAEKLCYVIFGIRRRVRKRLDKKQG